MSNFVVLCLLHIFISKQAGSQAGFLHFLPRSRDQLKVQVLMYHHRLPSQAPSLVSKAAPTKSAACCRMEYGIVPVSPNDRQLPKDEFHWENVKHLTVRLALIHDAGTAIQKPNCAKTTKIRIFKNFLEELSII